MIEKLFKNSRYLVFLTIMVSLVSSVTLYMASLNIIFHILSDFFTNPTIKPLDGQILAVNLLGRVPNSEQSIFNGLKMPKSGKTALNCLTIFQYYLHNLPCFAGDLVYF